MATVSNTYTIPRCFWLSLQPVGLDDNRRVIPNYKDSLRGTTIELYYSSVPCAVFYLYLLVCSLWPHISRVRSSKLHLLCILTILCNVHVIGTDLISFGITIKDETDANTPDLLLTLWWNTSIYQCEVYPVDDGNNFEYLCDDWTVLGQICLAEYKMMIDNSDSEDTPIIDSMIVNTATAFYGISDWCLPDDEVPWGFLDSWESTLNQCSSGYSNYDAICVATTGDRCAPGIIMTYFDGNSPNTFHDTSLWESVSDSTIEYNTCSPTAIPTLRPSVDPTYRPTEDPTEIPTDYPSAIPTKSPTDLPTKRRTQIPTKSPTSDPTKFPSKTPSSVPTENSSADLTQHPTMKPTVPYMIAAQSSTLPAASQSSVMSTTEIPEDASVQSIPYNQSENTSDHLLFIVISAFSAVICILIFVVIRLSRRKTVIAQSKTAQNKELTETVQIRMATDEKAMVTSISLQSIPDVHSSDLSKGADLYPTIENERVIQTLCAMNERVNGFDTTTYGDDSSSSSSALGDMYTTRNALADGIQTIGDDAVVRKGNARLAAPELDRPVSSLSTKENDVKKNESIEFTRNFIQ